MNQHIVKFLIIAGAAAIIMLPAEMVYASPYKLSPVTDTVLIGSGAALYGLSFYTDKNVDALDDEEISALSKKEINSFDRSAADNWSPSADKWSNRIITPVILSPIAFLAEDETRSDFLTIGVMYAESVLITRGLNGSAKNIVQRKRPFVYNTNAPDSDKKEKDAVRSFYSGHTVNAFNSAVFLGTVYSDYHPGNPWRFAVWGTMISAASFTGYLRYRAGMHYPTDIITGAAIGSLTGWMVPMLHRTTGENVSIQFTAGEEKALAVILSF